MKDNGGNAFPMPGYYQSDPNNRLEPSERMGYSNDPHYGMTLRDWFEGQALIGLLGNPSDLADEHGNVVGPEKVKSLAAEIAYQYADAMIQERNGSR